MKSLQEMDKTLMQMYIIVIIRIQILHHMVQLKCIYVPLIFSYSGL